jgi:transposase
VIGLDELGPVSAKPDPGEGWGCGPGRATFPPDDGRRGTGWGLGACEPATGLAVTLCRPRRDRASFIQLLELVLQASPARPWVLLSDTLTTHLSRETQPAVVAWPEVQLWLLPKYACWLNLIEPWWQQLRRLALKGRRCERLAEVIEAVVQATMSWNAHGYPSVWKKAT